jgi:hypothetical protein
LPLPLVCSFTVTPHLILKGEIQGNLTTELVHLQDTFTPTPIRLEATPMVMFPNIIGPVPLASLMKLRRVRTKMETTIRFTGGLKRMDVLTRLTTGRMPKKAILINATGGLTRKESLMKPSTSLTR